MKAKYLKFILLVVMMLPSAMSNAQSQVVTNAGNLDEALKFLYDNMVYVEGGTYLKGESQVSTTVGSFYCCRYETLYWLWRHVMDQPEDEDMGDMAPIMGPTWTQFQQFIKKLNHYAGIRYRLLTDDEWEYAARGGKLCKGYLYAGSNNIDDVAWYEGNWKWPLVVGGKKPNELGLYDMSGNAEEWCQDTIPSVDKISRRTPYADLDSLPEAPDFGKHRYVRGGGFLYSAEECTVYAHYGQPSEWSMPTIGCRLALDISEYNKLKPSKFKISMKPGESGSEISCEADYIQYNPQTRKFIIPSSDDTGGGIATELDIAQIDYISRATVSQIRLPEGTSTGNIVVKGDDEDIEIAEDGSFESEAGTLIAYNDDNLMYLNLSPGRLKGQKIALNGIETAASMIAMLFPDAFQEMSLENFTIFKLALAQLKETRALGDAIDNTVATKGCFEMSDVQKEYDAVLARLLQLANVDNSETVNSPLRRAPRNPAFYVWDDPNYPPKRVDKVHGNGYYVVLNKSTWLPEGTDKEKKPLWQCDFTVYNGSRYCYMFVTDGFHGDDGLNYPTSTDPFDMIRYVVKPQGISKLMDFGTVNDLAEMKFLTEPIESILSWDFEEDGLPIKSEVDFSKVEAMFKETLPLWGAVFKGESYDTTWDHVKKSGIVLDFEQGEDQLLVLGPRNSPLLSLYNYCMKIVIPAFKFYKGISKIGEDDDDDDSAEGDEEMDWGNLIVEYFKDLEYSDTDFYVELKTKLEDKNVSLKEFTIDMGKKFVESIINFAAKKGDELIEKKLVNTKEVKKITKMLKGHSTALSEIEKVFKVVKLVYDGCDLILGTLDWNYSGTSFQIQFDFNEPTGGIDPIPGEDL